MVFTFHVRAPPGLQFNHNLPKVPKFRFKKPMTALWFSDHSAIYCGLHICLAIANDLSLTVGFTRIDRKVILMQLVYQFNSYNLMHIQESKIRYKRVNKAQGWWFNAPRLSLITTILVSSQLDACGPPNTHRSCFT
jgi:hypothetical protein